MRSKPSARQRAALTVFVAIWLFAIVMRLASLQYPAAWVFVEGWGVDGHPTVQGYMTDTAEAESQLRVGDRLLQIGGVDLEGQGQLRFQITVAEVVRRITPPIPIALERDGVEIEILETPPPGRAASYYTGYAGLLVSLVWGIAAILILLRAPATVGSRALFLGLASHAWGYVALFEGPPLVYMFSLLFTTGVALVAPPLLLGAFLSFPAEAQAFRGWNRVWPWAFSVLVLPPLGAWAAFPVAPDVGFALGTPLFIAYILVILGTLAHNYKRSGAVGRRRIKWVVYAVYVGGVVGILTIVIAGPTPATPPLWAAAAMAIASMSYPLSFLIAALRSDLLDIDRLISATVAFNLLGALAIAGGFLVFPPIIGLLTVGVVQDPMAGQFAVAVGMAGLVVVGNRWVRPMVDRVLFRERLAFEQAMNDLPLSLAAAGRSEDLWQVTGDELVKALRVESCVFFIAAGDALVPGYKHGETVPPAIKATSDFVQLAAKLHSAVRVDRRMRRAVGSQGQTVLAGLEAQVVMPVHRSGQLEALVCLGEKRSGDIFSQTDLALLTALSQSLSIHLMRFDDAERLERAQTHLDRMRRYVPGPVKDLIDTGDALSPGVHDVSVLFVDIRGYTSFSEGRDVADTFSTINRYTQAATNIVLEGGGAVVEFNGDGMMAVFGVPKPLDHKERAAVSVALRLVEEVPKVTGAMRGARSVSVGVGVATGEAFVGSIEAADRAIWSAIGETTNLAARLQMMTRTLDASVLIDSVTHERAGDVDLTFVGQSDVVVPGTSTPQTIYALPIEA